MQVVQAWFEDVLYQASCILEQNVLKSLRQDVLFELLNTSPMHPLHM